jgi:hypothetical protein
MEAEWNLAGDACKRLWSGFLAASPLKSNDVLPAAAHSFARSILPSSVGGLLAHPNTTAESGTWTCVETGWWNWIVAVGSAIETALQQATSAAVVNV